MLFIAVTNTRKNSPKEEQIYFDLQFGNHGSKSMSNLVMLYPVRKPREVIPSVFSSCY